MILSHLVGFPLFLTCVKFEHCQNAFKQFVVIIIIRNHFFPHAEIKLHMNGQSLTIDSLNASFTDSIWLWSLSLSLSLPPPPPLVSLGLSFSISDNTEADSWTGFLVLARGQAGGVYLRSPPGPPHPLHHPTPQHGAQTSQHIVVGSSGS